jgi:hypothetical protein
MVEDQLVEQKATSEGTYYPFWKGSDRTLSPTSKAAKIGTLSNRCRNPITLSESGSQVE